MPFSLTDISASEMTYIVSSGALNSTHSLIQSNCIVFAVVLMFRFLAINFYFPYIFHLHYIILLCYIPFLYLCGVSVYLSVFCCICYVPECRQYTSCINSFVPYTIY